MPDTIPLPITDLHAPLNALREQLARSADHGPEALCLLHRDAAYAALDTGDHVTAMTHGLACLDLARRSGDAALRVKAHVALALVHSSAYDDLGGDEHFVQAEQLAGEYGDHRGVALVVVNRAHSAIERDAFVHALMLLERLRHTPHYGALSAEDSAGLRNTYHINYVVAASEALMSGLHLPYPVQDVRAHLAESAAHLRELTTHPDRLTTTLGPLDVLDALTRAALHAGDFPEALTLAHRRVVLAQQTGNAQLMGGALEQRGRVAAAQGRWPAATEDFRAALRTYQEGRLDLLAGQAGQRLAEAYAQAGRFEEAYATQLIVTLSAQQLHREIYQQRALLSQMEQQARDAEVRAAAFAEAALRDGLTGVPNRTHAMQLLTFLHQQARTGQPSAVALMDLDHFKAVNDTYGHPAGDVVLTRVAERLSAALRRVDCLARFGGEEFVLIFSGLDPADAQRTCERLLGVLRDIDWSDLAPDLHVTASFGVANLNPDEDLAVTLSKADQALYAVKHGGRNGVRLWTDGAAP